MGEDKSLLPFKNYSTLIEYQYRKLSEIFSKVYISSKTNKFDFNGTILFDESEDIYSPMVALKSILQQIKEEKIFIVTVDVPFIKEETFISLVNSSNNFKVTIAKDSQNTHNLCGVFSKSLIPIIENLLHNDIHKITTLIQSTHNYKEIFFNDSEQFININTIDEYNKYKL